jgi:hypothetical protein
MPQRPGHPSNAAKVDPDRLAVGLQDLPRAA